MPGSLRAQHDVDIRGTPRNGGAILLCDGGLITREDYAEVATTLILEGIGAVR